MYHLSQRSLGELMGVEQALQDVAHRAIEITTQDFMVFDGIRDAEEQHELFLKGASKLDGYDKISRHQDGRAIDLVPYESGPRWEWPLIYPVAVAVLTAARELEVRLRWGGVWDRDFNDLPATEDGLRAAVRAYALRHEGPDFLDGPHYELV